MCLDPFDKRRLGMQDYRGDDGGQFASSVPEGLVRIRTGPHAGWCGDVAAPVDVKGLAARAGHRPSTGTTSVWNS